MDIFVSMTEDSTINFKLFPTTRYQGSKRKILYWIHECIKDLDFDCVIDAFGGSASFSYLAKKMGKKVIYNDLMRFNYLIGKSVIENQGVTVTKSDLSYVLYNVPIDKEYNFIQENFKDYYFLDDENIWLDKTISNIYSLPGLDTEIEYKRSILFNALFQASLAKRPFNLFHRKNLYIRTADVKRNFGNKTTWEKPFDDLMVSFINQINDSVFDSKVSCISENKSVFEIEYQDADCVYLDPPYYNSKCTNETSNYFKCYHFLEGISKYHNWGALINDQATNKGFKVDHTSDHFNKKNINESFDQLFAKFIDKTIILSYKSGGKPSIEHLENTLKKMGKKVYTQSIGYSYALNREGKKGVPTFEALIIAK